MTNRVLIVDDHAAFRDRARLLLESEGYEVVGEAPDGSTAVVAAFRLRPDLALIDVQLPDTTGFEVAEQLRVAGTARSIVLISVRRESDFGERVARSAADGFIEKADLSRRAIGKAIGRSR